MKQTINADQIEDTFWFPAGTTPDVIPSVLLAKDLALDTEAGSFASKLPMKGRLFPVF